MDHVRTVQGTAVTIQLELFFVNQTDGDVFISGCMFDLPSPILLQSEASIEVEHSVELGLDVNVNTFIPIIDNSCKVYYGESAGCEQGIYVNESYSEKVKLDESTFRFVFHFTQERKEAAATCE